MRTLIALAFCTIILASVAFAQPLASASQIQDDLTAQRAAAIVRERKLANVREDGLLAKLEERDSKLRAVLRDLSQG